MILNSHNFTTFLTITRTILMVFCFLRRQLQTSSFQSQGNVGASRKTVASIFIPILLSIFSFNAKNWFLFNIILNMDGMRLNIFIFYFCHLVLWSAFHKTVKKVVLMITVSGLSDKKIKRPPLFYLFLISFVPTIFT